METDEVVKLMDNRQYGVYHKLLGHNWLEGSIPADIGQLATLVHEDPRDFESMWSLISKKFRRKGSGRLTNPRQEKERKKQKLFSKKQADAARKRWERQNGKKQKQGIPKTVPPHQSGINPAHAKSCSSSSSSFASADIERMFNSLWEKYPKKDGKKAALNHFKAAIKSGVDPGRIEIAMAKYVGGYVREKGIKDEFIKNGSTFFNNWQDWENYVPKSQEASIKAAQIAKQEAEHKARQNKEEAAKEEAFNRDLETIKALPKAEYDPIYEEAGRRGPMNRFAKNSGLLLSTLLVEVWRERKAVPA